MDWEGSLITPAVWAAVVRMLAEELAGEAVPHQQAGYDLLIATHPDLVELNAQMDALYDI